MEDRLQIILSRIITGENPVIVFNSEYVYKEPTAVEYHDAVLYSDKYYKNLLIEGILTSDDTLEILKEKNLWSDSLEKELSQLIKDRESLSKKLPELEFKTLEKQRVLDTIEIINDRQSVIIRQKNSLMVNTAEYLTKIEKFKRLLFLCLRTPDGRRVWTDWNAFYSGTNYDILYQLITSIFIDDDIEEKDIRKIARSDPWRSMWRIGQKTGRLFDVAAINLSPLQRHLCMWSIIYDNAMESSNAPSMEILDNDILFDEWMRNKAENKTSNNSPINKYGDHQEVYIPVDTPEDAQKVYKLNSGQGLSTIRSREAAIQKHGKLSEHELPDVKKDLMMQKNRMIKESVGRFNK